MDFESRFLKFLHIPLLVLTNAVTITLLCLLDRRFTGSLYHRVIHHRAIAAVIVQIASTLLAAAQVYVLCTLINFATRLQSVQRFIRAKSLSLLAALSVPRIDWTLEWYSIVIAGTFFVIGPLLGAVWAGALTPLVANSLREDGKMNITRYEGRVDAGWEYQGGGSIGLNCPGNKLSLNITIGGCPAIGYVTNLLGSALGATPTLNISRVHPRIEVPAWSYKGRSYGVGASTGLYNPTVDSDHSYTTYTYDEPGYLSVVSCAYNETSDLTIVPSGYLEESPLVIWQVNGSLPNRAATDESSYTLTTANTDWWDEVVGWSAAGANGRNMLAIATYTGDASWNSISPPDHWYPGWNNMQCSIEFQPTLFNVLVDLNSSTVSVTPKGTHADFEPTGTLQSVIMQSLDLVSRMSSNIGVSTLGVALNTNSDAMSAFSTTYNLKMSSADTLTHGAQNMITSLVDDLLVAYASRQMVIFGGTDLSPVQKQFDAVRLGSPRFIYISLGINIALVLLVLAETVRTKAWQHLPAFDFTDLQSVMAAAILSPSHNDDPALVSGKLKRASIKWSRLNDDSSVVMLVRLPSDTSKESLQSSKSSISKLSPDGIEVRGTEMRQRPAENREPLLTTSNEAVPLAHPQPDERFLQDFEHRQP